MADSGRVEGHDLRREMDTRGRVVVRASRLRSGGWALGHLVLLGIGAVIGVGGVDRQTWWIVALGFLTVVVSVLGLAQTAPGVTGRARVEVGPAGVTVRGRLHPWVEVRRVEAQVIGSGGWVRQTQVVLVPEPPRRRRTVLPRGLVVRQRPLLDFLVAEHRSARSGVSRPRFHAHEQAAPPSGAE